MCMYAYIREHIRLVVCTGEQGLERFAVAFAGWTHRDGCIHGRIYLYVYILYMGATYKCGGSHRGWAKLTAILCGEFSQCQRQIGKAYRQLAPKKKKNEKDEKRWKKCITQNCRGVVVVQSNIIVLAFRVKRWNLVTFTMVAFALHSKIM